MSPSPRKGPAPARPPEQVNCARCGTPSSVREVLEHCSVSWPNQSWILFTCPKCRKSSHVEVTKGRLSIGGLDGAPGPCFMPSDTVAVKNLDVTRSDGGGMIVRYDGRGWLFRAKP